MNETRIRLVKLLLTISLLSACVQPAPTPTVSVPTPPVVVRPTAAPSGTATGGLMTSTTVSASANAATLPLAAVNTPTASSMPLPTTVPTLALTFGVEQAHLLFPILGQANVFGNTRIPAPEASFAPDGNLYADFREFAGLREYVVKALNTGRVAMVIDVQADDSTERVQNKVRAVLALNPQSPPWLLIIGNELNLKSNSAYPPATYYAQFHAAYQTAKAIAPTVQLSLDGENYWDGTNSPEPGLRVQALERLRQVLNLCQQDNFAPDYVTLHVYDSLFAPGRSDSARSLERRAAAYRNLLASYRLPKTPELYVGEYGLPVVSNLPANPLRQWDRLRFSEDEQANLVFMAAAWSMARRVELNYYAALDTPTAQRRQDTGEGAYGLVAEDGRQRPAFAALRHAQTVLASVTEASVLADGSAGVGAIQFTLADGRQVWIAQATTQKAVEWPVPAPAGSTLSVEDVLGQPLPDAAVAGRNAVRLPAALASRAGGAVRVIIGSIRLTSVS